MKPAGAAMPSRRPAARRSRALAAGLALVLALGPGGARAEFGTLFFSRAERDALDRPPPAADAGPARRQRIDGILRRPDGLDTVWLDGEAGAPPPGFRLAPAPALALVPDDAAQPRLRVGDSWPPPDTAVAMPGEQAAHDAPLPRLRVGRGGAAAR